jgi:hypothetical protein
MALLLEQQKMINWLQKKIPIPNKDSSRVQKENEGKEDFNPNTR